MGFVGLTEKRTVRFSRNFVERWTIGQGRTHSILERIHIMGLCQHCEKGHIGLDRGLHSPSVLLVLNTYYVVSKNKITSVLGKQE